jgi:hypothetical protein
MEARHYIYSWLFSQGCAESSAGRYRSREATPILIMDHKMNIRIRGRQRSGRDLLP